MKCPLCDKGRLVRKKSPFMYGDIYFDKYNSDVCSKCGEVIFTEESALEIEKKAKELGIWGIEKKSKISYAGNSLMVRIPRNIAKFMKLRKGEEILIRPEGKKKLVVTIG